MAETKSGDVRQLARVPGEWSRAARFEAAMVHRAREEANAPSPAFAAGTSANSLAAVKLASEEARHALCPDCGCSSGRHLKVCSR